MVEEDSALHACLRGTASRLGRGHRRLGKVSEATDEPWQRVAQDRETWLFLEADFIASVTRLAPSQVEILRDRFAQGDKST